MRTRSLITFVLLLLVAGCAKTRQQDYKHWTWKYIRYNAHKTFDSAHHVISTSFDTTNGVVQDTIFIVSADEIYFHKLNYYLRTRSDTLRTFEHLIYDSGDPTGEMSYYPGNDSVFLKLEYTTPAYPVISSTEDYGVEYWSTTK